MDRTFVMIKPDGVRRGVIGEIVGRFERRGIRVVGLKIVQPTREIAERHYAVHRDKPFYAELIDFVTSGPVVPMVLEADGVVPLVRSMMGALKPINALPGTIRGDMTTSAQCNLVHGSDAPETAAEEIAIWFSPDELLASE